MKVRVLMHINWRIYRAGYIYDIDDEAEVQALISNGMLTLIPFPEPPAVRVPYPAEESALIEPLSEALPDLGTFPDSLGDQPLDT